MAKKTAKKQKGKKPSKKGYREIILRHESWFLSTVSSFAVWAFFIYAYFFYKYAITLNGQLIPRDIILPLFGIVFAAAIYALRRWVNIVAAVALLYPLFNPVKSGTGLSKGFFIASFQAFAFGDISSSLMFLIASVPFIVMIAYSVAGMFAEDMEGKVFSAIFLLFAIPLSTGLAEAAVFGTLRSGLVIESLFLAAAYFAVLFAVRKETIAYLLRPTWLKAASAVVILFLWPVSIGYWTPGYIIMLVSDFLHSFSMPAPHGFSSMVSAWLKIYLPVLVSLIINSVILAAAVGYIKEKAGIYFAQHSS